MVLKHTVLAIYVIFGQAYYIFNKQKNPIFDRLDFNFIVFNHNKNLYF